MLHPQKLGQEEFVLEGRVVVSWNAARDYLVARSGCWQSGPMMTEKNQMDYFCVGKGSFVGVSREEMV